MTSAADGEAEWLTADQLATWRALHHLISRLPGVLTAQLQCDSDLSFVEYYVLATLSEQPDHTIRMSRLAVLANSELSRLSHMVGRLEKRGFVRRSPDPDNGRYNIAILTPAGYESVVQAAPGHVQMVRRTIFEVLDTEQQHVLRDAANAVLGHLNSKAAGPADT